MSGTNASDLAGDNDPATSESSDSQPRQEQLFPDPRSAAFRARLKSGNYRELFDARLGKVMAQAAAEAGVADELGALRIVMARLLAEQDDPVVLAPLIARIASVSIQAARVQRTINGQLAESLTDALTTILAELDGSDG